MNAVAGQVVPPIPARLCKFRTYGASDHDTARVHAMLTGRLPFSPPSMFNDPFEGRPQYRAAFDDPVRQSAAMLEYLIEIAPGGGTRAQRQAWAETTLARKGTEEIIEYLNAQEIAGENGARILCLTHPDSIKRPILWSHYADSHRGLCIHFDTSFMPLRFAWQVSYEEEYPTLLMPRTAAPPWDVVRNTHLTKSPLWEYEEEYRVVRLLLDGAGIATHLNVQWADDVALCDARVAVEVTIGCRMPEARRAQLMAWVAANAPHIQIWQASLHRHRYELVRERVA